MTCSTWDKQTKAQFHYVNVNHDTHVMNLSAPLWNYCSLPWVIGIWLFVCNFPTCSCVCIHTNTRKQIQLHMHMQTHPHIQMRTHTSIHTHTHTHSHTHIFMGLHSQTFICCCTHTHNSGIVRILIIINHVNKWDEYITTCHCILFYVDLLREGSWIWRTGP